MIAWWGEAGIDRADLAVKRPCSTMAWHRGLALDRLPLPWARAENVRHADVYIRPAREGAWPLVFLDDVPEPVARRIARKYDALVVRTSRHGGCHLWLSTTARLDETRRGLAQRWLVERIEADGASVSGEHLGRLAGFRNWKRGGEWVNVLAWPRRDRPWAPEVALTTTPPSTSGRPPARLRTGGSSPSEQEWGWVCGLLESGEAPEIVRQRLTDQAGPRRGPDTDRYVDRTLSRALDHVGSDQARTGRSARAG